MLYNEFKVPLSTLYRWTNAWKKSKHYDPSDMSIHGPFHRIFTEPSAAVSSTLNINNSIINNKREDGKEDIVIMRDIEVQTEPVEVEPDVRNVILEAYAQILLNQDKAQLANIISKKCIIVPIESLSNIIKAILHVNDVEVQLIEDVGCCEEKS